MKNIIAAAALCAVLLPACTPRDAPAPADAASIFFDNVSTLCGKAYSGRLVSGDAVDADFASLPLTIHVRDCSADEIRIPFTVGDDRSRTFVLTRTTSGLRLKHSHLHEDGSADDLTQYGGDSSTITPTRAEFPADDFSKALFSEADIPDSRQNTWALEANPNARVFVYEMSRPERFFRVEFDTSAPVPPPSTPHWGDPD